MNRHLIVIQKLNHRFKEISLDYEFSDSYGRNIFRFLIRYKLLDGYELSQEDREVFEKYLGGGLYYWQERKPYVSFVYKHQNSFQIEFDILESFIVHYQFAIQIFEGFVKEVIPNVCSLSIASLRDESVFNYAYSYLLNSKYSGEKDIGFKKEYKEVMQRSFDFDVSYHSTLIESAVKIEKRKKKTN